MFLCMPYKCQVKNVLSLRLLCLLIVIQAMIFMGWGQAEGHNSCIFSEFLTDFTQETYFKAATKTIEHLEKQVGCQILPQTLSKIALKIYTSSCINFCTPHALVNAMIEFLLKRGFREEDIYVVDGTEYGLTSCRFKGAESLLRYKVNVVAFETSDWKDEAWFYDCALPSEVVNRFIKGPIIPECQGLEGRKSYLPRIFMEEAYWINMPMEMDHKVLGVSGAMVNASLGIASNTTRFYGSELTGPSVVAEILAIPEVNERMLFTIVSLEKYQYAGGPIYNAHYTAHEKVLWVSNDPVRIDYEMYLKMNQLRLANRITALRMPAMFKYAQMLERAELWLGGSD